MTLPKPCRPSDYYRFGHETPPVDSKGAGKLKEMMDEAKSKYTWELNEAIINLQHNVYILRKKRGWSQRELARQMGVSQPHVVRHLTWGDGITLDSLAKYAHALEVTIDKLIGEPIFLPPYPLFNDSGEVTGHYTVSSTAHTITRKANK